MRKYYLFMIKNDYYQVYKRNSQVLYRTLENLYQLSKPNFQYGVSLFDNICQPFSVKLLNNYIKNRIPYQMYSDKVIELHSTQEKTKIQINYATIIIISNVNFPSILKIFNIYNKRIFVCDFRNQDYFWLNEQTLKRK